MEFPPQLSTTLRLLLVGLVLTACGSSEKFSTGKDAPAGSGKQPEQPGIEEVQRTSWPDSILKGMSLEQKVGQMIMARTYGHFINRESDEYQRLVRLVSETGIGGLVVFQGDVFETALLLNDLQRQSSVPLLVAADFERGAAMRIRRATYFPEAMVIGATGNPDYAFAIGKAIAEEARALGVHQNFAPVADINNNPANPVINTRSFGEDKELVATMVAAFVRGTNEGCAISTAKHFPGHGDTGIDSHLDLPVLPFDRTRLDTMELVSFKRAIADDVGSIMVAHLEVPSVDSIPGLPASLSAQTVTGLLRTDLGFDGLIVTDAMEMRGILKGYSIGESAVRAVKAGVDIVLIPADETVASRAIIDAVRSGELTESRIDASVTRILSAKSHLGLDRERFSDLNAIGNLVGSNDHVTLAREVARKGITVVKNEGGLIPLRPSAGDMIGVLIVGDSEEGRTDVNRPGSQLTNEAYGAYFLQLVRQRVPGLQVHRVNPALHKAHLDSVLAETRKYDVLVIGLYAKVRGSTGKTDLPDNLEQMVGKYPQSGQRVFVISFGNPYILRKLPGVQVAMCAYSDSEVMVESAVEALFGEIGISGQLPVTIPGYAPFKQGIDIAQSVLRKDRPTAAGFNEERLKAVDSLVLGAIRDSAFPGAQVAVVRSGVLLYDKSFGRLSYGALQPEVTSTTMYDLASLTKVVATTPAVMRLCDEGRMALDDPVVKYIPAFVGANKASVTIRQMLTHTSGLPAHKPFYRTCTTPQEVLDSLYATTLVAPPGDTTIYSDLGMMVLGRIVEAVSGLPLDRYVAKEFYAPLRMGSTMFNPPSSSARSIAPTELDTVWRKQLVQGRAHDENAEALGGVAGHAGLFSTAGDLALFMQMMMNGGTYGVVRFLESVADFTKRQDARSTRALGWDTKTATGSSAGMLFSSTSFGHTGFTGTSIWVDSERGLGVVVLTNRIHPVRSNNGIQKFRPALHDAVIRAMVGDLSEAHIEK